VAAENYSTRTTYCGMHATGYETPSRACETTRQKSKAMLPLASTHLLPCMVLSGCVSCALGGVSTGGGQRLRAPGRRLIKRASQILVARANERLT